MSERWTKGPWNVNYSKFSQVQAENGALIATCNRLDTLVNLQANAHLIAAAPEMYEALELIYGRLLMSDRDGESRITAEDGKMAELALKKARGEL